VHFQKQLVEGPVKSVGKSGRSTIVFGLDVSLRDFLGDLGELEE